MNPTESELIKVAGADTVVGTFYEGGQMKAVADCENSHIHIV